MAARDPGGEKHAKEGLSRASRPQDLARPFFFEGLFRVSLDGLTKRRTTRSLVKTPFSL